MPKPSQWSAVGNALNQLGFSNAAADAMSHASEADAEERADSVKQRQMNADYQALQANIRAGKERARLAGDGVPDGFEHVKDIKALPRRGEWPFLQGDLCRIWWPLKTFSAMCKRSQNGDQDAKAWLQLWSQALSGDDRAALRQMGEITESGRYGAEVDLDRAFFWYYRAGLAGDSVAREHALRLKRSTDIDPATMGEPQFIGPAGNWRITMDNFGQGSTTAIVELDLNGTLSGSVEAFGGPALGMLNNAMGGDPELQAFVSSLMQSIGVEGRWAYDKKYHILSIEMLFSSPTVPGAQTLSAQVQILGQNVVAKEKLLVGERILFGRDKAGAAYYFAPFVPRR